MPRPMWKGHLSFGLVMMPVSLMPAETATADLDLDMLDERDQARIRFRRVNERTGKEVPWKSIVKGFEYEEGRYAVLAPEDFKAAAAEVVKGGIEILDFVERESVSPVYFEKPYYMLPAKGGEKVYGLLRESLKRSDRIGIAKVVISTRQRLAALMVDGSRLLLVTMRFADELKDASELELPSGATRVNPREIEMAEKLVESMSSKWDPSKYHDEYRDALKRIIKDKSRGPDGGKRAPKPEEHDVPETYSIMDLLRKSVEGEGRTAKKRAVASRRSATAPRRARTVPRRKAG